MRLTVIQNVMNSIFGQVSTSTSASYSTQIGVGSAFVRIGKCFLCCYRGLGGERQGERVRRAPFVCAFVHERRSKLMCVRLPVCVCQAQVNSDRYGDDGLTTSLWTGPGMRGAARQPMVTNRPAPKPTDRALFCGRLRKGAATDQVGADRGAGKWSRSAVACDCEWVQAERLSGRESEGCCCWELERKWKHRTRAQRVRRSTSAGRTKLGDERHTWHKMAQQGARHTRATSSVVRPSPRGHEAGIQHKFMGLFRASRSGAREQNPRKCSAEPRRVPPLR